MRLTYDVPTSTHHILEFYVTIESSKWHCRLSINQLIVIVVLLLTADIVGLSVGTRLGDTPLAALIWLIGAIAAFVCLPAIIILLWGMTLATKQQWRR